MAGLGASPTDVVINGSINVYNRCRDGVCFALDNFWRSLSNLTINVTDPAGAGCYAGNFWAVSQAAPMRRVNITGGNLTLMDYCTGPSFASGGYIADSQAGLIINGSQQQFLVRNSNVGTWTNGVWNQVFSGVVGAPGECFPATKDAAGFSAGFDKQRFAFERLGDGAGIERKPGNKRGGTLRIVAQLLLHCLFEATELAFERRARCSRPTRRR